ncbi:hypothetical protein EVAR_19715_1 [Eumeta japonica]|uniref:Uncharacterized protein n=1 Tax=Eumeta variegata TaxID=151549 RepID=A0A4C1US82_EUMVA|nr:hypothetical protein EVAR_19715_1 [Eumeta japonica]
MRSNKLGSVVGPDWETGSFDVSITGCPANGPLDFIHKPLAIGYTPPDIHTPKRVTTKIETLTRTSVGPFCYKIVIIRNVHHCGASRLHNTRCVPDGPTGRVGLDALTKGKIINPIA